MAVTETPAGATAMGAAPEGGEPPARPEVSGLAAVLGSGDHKVIGRAYIVASIVFGLGAAIAGQLVAVERVDAERFSVLGRETYFQVFTYHSVTATFLFLLPLVLGLALVVVPLQVGARTVAFPRAAAASFWTWLLAGGLVVTSYLINGGPGGGRDRGVDLWAVSLGAVLVGLLVGAACVVVTVFGLRAPGMSLGRVPLFSWSMLVAGAMWLVTLPVLVGTLALIYVDHRHGRVTFGEEDTIYARIVWALRHPQVYAFAVPVLGFAADVIAVSARTRQVARGAAMAAIAAFGALGFGAFVQQSVYAQGTRQPAFIGVSLLAVLPVLALLALWGGSLRKGRPSVNGPVLFAVSAVLMLLVAVLAGALGSIPRLEVTSQEAGGTTTWDAAVTHYATLAATIAALGGLHWWATKVIGRRAGEGLGRLAPLVLLLGTVLLAFPDLVSSLIGDDDEKSLGIEALNVGVAIGGVLVIVGILAAVANLLAAVRGGRRRGDDEAPSDPWEGHTLEWATPSPPPLHNFTDVPAVGSPEPLLDRREEVTT